MRFQILLFFLFFTSLVFAQEDTLSVKSINDSTIKITEPPAYQDTVFRIINLNPYFTLHVDSILNYDFEINRPQENYFWFLINSPVGVKIDRQTGSLYIKADKNLFKTGRLKYDIPYNLKIGVQNLYNPTERVDTNFTVLFYSTEVVISRLKLTSSPTVFLEEGDSVQFKVQCEEGSFPIEQISLNSSMPLSNFKSVSKCGDEFKWEIPFGFFKDKDTAKQKIVSLDFIGLDKFFNKDTANIKLVIRPGINYPVRNLAYREIAEELDDWVKELKITFYGISQSVKKTKKTRTTFDIGSSSTALAGTVISTTAESGSTGEKIGKVMPSVGLTLVPVKEAVAPNRVQEQNSAAQVRAEARRLEYLLSDNRLDGDRDPLVLEKIKRLSDELKKSRLQFVELPMVEYDQRLTDEDADKYFKDPKVNKKYKLKLN